jgi:VCBS repeat-containing protein
VETFTVDSADGTDTQTITVTVTGTNDVAVIGGTTTGSVTEDSATTTATGTLTATDVDNTNNLFQAVAAGTATTNGYGTFGMTTAGVWTYTLDNSNSIVNALNTGGTLSDSFTVLSDDGTSQVVNVTINGNTDVVNHAPTNITLKAADYGNSLPGGGDTVATIVTTDVNAGDTHTYTVTGPGAAGFSTSGSNLVVSAAGLTNNSTYTIHITATDSGSATYVETFNIITGSGNANTLPTGGTGLANEDILYGLNNSDIIYGGAGADTLFGQAGDDALQGGDGNDTLNGGAGSDQFIFNTALGASNVDTIIDFISGTDKIVLDDAVFTALSPGALSAGAFDVVGVGAAATTSTRIIYDQSTGVLSYDADGTDPGAAVQIALIGVTAHPTLVVGDFIVI